MIFCVDSSAARRLASLSRLLALLLLAWSLSNRALLDLTPGLVLPPVSVGIFGALGLLLLIPANYTAAGAVLMAGIAAVALGTLFRAIPPGLAMPRTAALLCLGLIIGFALSRTRSARLVTASQLIAFVILQFGSFLLMRYAFTQRPGIELLSFLGITFAASVAISLASLSLLLARPYQGLLPLISSDTFAGATTRRLLPCVTLIPFALTWLRYYGQLHGFYDVEVGLSAQALAMTLILEGIVLISAWHLAHGEIHRRRSEESNERALRELNAALDQRVRDRTLELERANQELRRQILEREAAERRLQLKQQMLLESSNMNALGRMAAGMAHEINNPLTLIYGKSCFLKGMAQDETAPISRRELIESLDCIERMSNRIVRIIQGLRIFSRDTSNEPTKPVAARQIVDDALALCQQRIKLHSISLSVASIPEDLLLDCRGVEISRVLLNLLNNSFDALEEVQNRRTSISIEDRGDRIALSVEDNGPGLSPEAREHLFHPFFTTKPIGKGTGLGLSTSKGIVEAHRGSIRCESSPGHTRFIVELPKPRHDAILRSPEESA